MNKIYIFNSTSMYFLDRCNGDFVEVEDQTVKVHNVEYTDGRWVFNRVDDPKNVMYTTNYDWALIEDTPGNVVMLKEAYVALDKSKLLHDEFETILKQVAKAVRP